MAGEIAPPLSPIWRGTQIVAFRFFFGVDRSSAAVLAELFAAGETPLTGLDLARRCDISLTTVRPRICDLRQVMREEAIDTTAYGYVLTDIGRREAAQACTSMARDLLGGVALYAEPEALAA